MRVPLSWLAEFVDLEAGTSTHDVHAALVSVGLEEEDVRPLYDAFPDDVLRLIDAIGIK